MNQAGLAVFHHVHMILTAGEEEKMKSGLLWYDGDKDKPLWDKIDEAAKRYFEKFGVQPNTCYVHQRALPDGKGSKRGNIRIQTSPTILPNHIWLGVND